MTNTDTRDLLDYIQELRDQLASTEHKLDAAQAVIDLLEADRRDAADELTRWQYSDHIESVRFSIDIAVRILGRAR